MKGHEKIAGACAETSRLVMRISALVLARTCDREMLAEVFEQSKNLNALMSIINNQTGLEEAHTLLEEIYCSKNAGERGVMAGSWLAVSAMILGAMGQEDNWTLENEEMHKNHKGVSESYEAQTKDLVESLIEKVKDKTRRASDEK